jgi:c-di-GMP-binding flagellar brake protein YcgR
MRTLHFRRIERRRTARVALSVDLIVHGETENSGTFKAEARTLSVSGHGGMMVLGPEVMIGQRLLLINMNSGQKAECTVVSVKNAPDGKRNVAFEFTSTEINFWKMCFPAPGAKPIRQTAQRRLEPVPATKLAQ